MNFSKEEPKEPPAAAAATAAAATAAAAASKIKKDPSVQESSGEPAAVPTKLKQRCTICTERFASKMKLEAHLRTTHLPKIDRYVCNACDETLSKSFDIKNHQLWHKLSKTPYKCNLCGEAILSTYAFAR